jgi:hypothetical protein
MNRKRPLAVTAIACLYLLVGVAGSVGHFPGRHEPDWVWIEVTEIAALIGGAFLLRGHNWARWLAVAWMAFHVAISVGHPIGELAVHVFFLVAITYLLFRRDAAEYFRTGVEGS